MGSIMPGERYPVANYPLGTLPLGVYQDPVYGPSGGPPFVPSDLPNLALWYDANQEVVVDGTAIASVADRSGNARHGLSAVGVEQPLLKKPIANGKPVYRFDGVDDWTQAVFAFDEPYTGIAVLRLNALNGVAAQRPVTYGSGDTFLVFNAGSSIGTMAMIALPDFGTVNFHIVGVTDDGVNQNAYFDSSAPVGPVASSAGATNMLVLGRYFNGALPGNVDIAEVILVGRVCSAGELASIVAYLKAKWGTP